MNTDKIFGKYSLEMILGFFILMFLILTGVSVITSTSTSDLNEKHTALEKAQSEQVVVDEDEIIAAREKRVAKLPDVDASIKKDLAQLLEKKDFDTFQKTYGKEIRVVLESEIKAYDATEIIVYNQPIYHEEDSYPIDIVLNGDIHIFANYQFEKGVIEPYYVSRKDVE